MNKFNVLRKRFAQESDGAFVDFNRNKPGAFRRKIFRERTLSRADFDDDIIGTEMQAVDNVARDVLVAKKILPEGFFGWQHARRDRVNIQNERAIFNETAIPLHFGLISVTLLHVF
jgi:hypothetical protein